MTRIEPGARPSPNIWRHAATYEIENRAVDPDGLIEQAMAEVRCWDGATVLDIGCGTGYHLPRFATRAERVVGVEPHGGLASSARRRCAGLRNVEVLAGTAQSLPVPDAAFDVVHARWAYFFGPGCEPGLREVERVLRTGGAAFVIDNDASHSTFGGWFRRAVPQHDWAAVERFWSSRGWTRTPVLTSWHFARRRDLEAVVRIEFAPELAAQLLSEHSGLQVDYAVNIWWRRR